MNRKLTLATLIAAAGLATAGGLAVAAQKTSAENDAVAELARTKITLTQAVAAAEQAHAGGKAAKAELNDENGAVVYEVEVVADNRQVFDVKVDAVSGKVLSSQADRMDAGKEDRD